MIVAVRWFVLLKVKNFPVFFGKNFVTNYALRRPKKLSRFVGSSLSLRGKIGISTSVCLYPGL